MAPRKASKPQPVEVNVEIDPRRISYKEYKRIMKAQKPGSDVSEVELWELVEKCVVNTEALDDLPFVDVVPAIMEALTAAFEGANQKN